VKQRVSVILPAYNEAKCIAKSIASVRDLFATVCKDLEIIVVDDGSTDETLAVAEGTADNQTKVVGYLRNQGKGHAIRQGFSRVTGEITFFLDSDMEIAPHDLAQYLNALKSVDIAIGSKRHPLSRVRTPAMRMFLSLGFNLLERMLTGVRASDTQSGVKCAKSEALYEILPLLSVKKYAFDAELLAVASLANLRIGEQPITIYLAASFKAKHVFRMLIDLLGIAYRLRVKRWYQKNMAKMTETYTPIIQW
jgi:glycosyltransferase involved in cell wall biosynthesis